MIAYVVVKDAKESLACIATSVNGCMWTYIFPSTTDGLLSVVTFRVTVFAKGRYRSRLNLTDQTMSYTFSLGCCARHSHGVSLCLSYIIHEVIIPFCANADQKDCGPNAKK